MHACMFQWFFHFIELKTPTNINQAKSRGEKKPQTHAIRKNNDFFFYYIE